jgi:NADPH:quinone reductase-like Zn-dependent oxidoreductase
MGHSTLKGTNAPILPTSAPGIPGCLKLKYTADDVAYLVSLAEEGKYRAVIDSTYNLADVVEAHRFVDTGRKGGNVVLRVHQLQGQLPKG